VNCHGVPVQKLVHHSTVTNLASSLEKYTYYQIGTTEKQGA